MKKKKQPEISYKRFKAMKQKAFNGFYHEYWQRFRDKLIIDTMKRLKEKV